MNLRMPENVEQAKAIIAMMGDKTIKEFAESLNMKMSTVYDRITRARKILDNTVIDVRGLIGNPVMHSAKILFWDLECSTIDLKIRQYDLRSHKGYHHYSTIQRDWTLLGAAWKWIYEDRVHCISVSSKDPMNDEGVVRKLHEVLSDADLIVAHNNDAFDIKKFNTRALVYGLPPIHINSVDTLKEARKTFKITSNVLGYLGKFLELGDEKFQSPDWNKILDGCPDELSKMREYNRQDVVLLEKVYFKLRGWMKNHPKLNLFHKIKDISGLPIQCCSTCGSPNLTKMDKPFYYKGSGRKQDQFRCDDCGSITRGLIKRR